MHKCSIFFSSLDFSPFTTFHDGRLDSDEVEGFSNYHLAYRAITISVVFGSCPINFYIKGNEGGHGK